MFTIESLVHVVLYLIVAGIIFGVLWWALIWSERELGFPSIFFKVARVLLVLGAVLVIISLLLGLAGHPIVVG
jgi:uncharacterized membrane protein